MEPYRKLGTLTKLKEEWRDNISYVGLLLDGQSSKVTAKAMWLLGEMGLQYPDDVTPYVGGIASFMDSRDDLLRERALNALGRIGRTRFENIKPFWNKMFELSEDSNPRVRLAFIWASENIATNNPEAYEHHLQPFAIMLNDSDDKVRIEAPEMFRVLGKRLPKLVEPYLDRLQWLAENDTNPVVWIHSAGAIRVITKNINTQRK